jgi:hypothetical protein
MDQDKLHELARLFMYQFSFNPLSLDEWLLEYGEELTDDERNLGYFILDLIDTE